jgi:hypothetical protein
VTVNHTGCDEGARESLSGDDAKAETGNESMADDEQVQEANGMGNDDGAWIRYHGEAVLDAVGYANGVHGSL